MKLQLLIKKTNVIRNDYDVLRTMKPKVGADEDVQKSQGFDAGGLFESPQSHGFKLRITTRAIMSRSMIA